jgi:hypothetical protein
MNKIEKKFLSTNPISDILPPMAVDLYYDSTTTIKAKIDSTRGLNSATTKSFSDGTLSLGKYLFEHKLNSKYVVIEVYDNLDCKVIPDEIKVLDSTIAEINLESYIPISGVWYATATYAGASTDGGSVPGGSDIFTYIEIDADHTAVKNEYLIANTSSGGFNVTLPAIVNVGDTVKILDSRDTFETYNLTIIRNGNNINSLNEDAILDISSKEYRLIYLNSTVGWKIIV